MGSVMKIYDPQKFKIDHLDEIKDIHAVPIKSNLPILSDVESYSDNFKYIDGGVNLKRFSLRARAWSIIGLALVAWVPIIFLFWILNK